MSVLRRAVRTALFSAILIASISQYATAAPPVIPGEFIVKFKPTVRAADRAALRASSGAQLIQAFSRVPELEHWSLPGVSPEEAQAMFQDEPGIAYIEPNYVVSIDVTPNDPRFPEMWQLRNTGQTGGTPGADIKATNAWDLFTGNHNVKVGVIDTGVDYNHPDLAANIWTNPGEIPANGVDDDGNGFIDDIHGWDFYNNDNDPFDDNGHGTHTSGTIAAVGDNNVGTVGVNWTAQIVGIKFLSGAGSGSTAGAIAGVNYAITIGVKLTSNSWGGGGFSQGLLDAINAAGAAGQLFVAAAGNASQNTDVNPQYPSAYNSPYIISVASTDLNDNLSSFSNWGPTTVDLAAPGSAILSTTPGNTYSVFSGTSMATPHVAGVAALAWGRFPALTNMQVKDLILLAVDVKPSLTGKVLTNGRLNAFMTIAEPDSVPPGFVTDLVTTFSTSNTMGLAWTAPGDDGNVGRCSRYEIRYSTSPITPGNFASATLVEGPDPQPYGSAETFEVTGLDFSTAYFFAIKAFDEFSNAGDMSNVATGTTLGAPSISANPGTFSASLLTGGTDTQTLTLTNTAQGTLDFTIPTPQLLFVQPPAVNEYVPIGKGQEDPRIGDPVLNGAGGPDAFGYRWVDSNEPGGPVYDWVDITGSGTQSTLTGDDASTGDIAMGIDFPFYGNVFNNVKVKTNGFLSFTDTGAPYDNQPLPTTGGVTNMVAPFWEDLDFGSTRRVYTYSDGTRFIVSWIGVPRYSSGGPYTFQAILYPTGEIRFQYQSMGSPVNSSTVGIQNGDRTVGLTVAFNTNYIQNSLAVQIVPLRQWLTVSPTAGRILAGESQALTVGFNALGLVGGDYEANIRILSNDPVNSPLALPAHLHVTGAPDLTVNPSALDYGQNFVGASPTRTITLANPGTDNLTVSGIVSSDPTLTTDFAGPLVLPPLAAHNVTVTYHPTSPGPLNATLTVQSDDPDTPNFLVTAVGSAVPAPAFSVDPTSFTESLVTNSSVTRNLRITNSGGSDFIFNIAAFTNAASGTVPVYGEADNVYLEKGEPDVQTGPTPLRSGGPDVFGYTFKDSDEPDGPTFSWIDIRPFGTQIPLTGDDVNYGTALPVGFNFPYYGNSFTTFRICTNGWISFTNTSTARANTALPNSGSGVPENLLAAFWDDLNFGTVQRAWYHYDGVKTVVQFQDVYRFGEASTLGNTFEIILYPDGTIVYQYLTMNATTKTSATIGIQNAARNDGLQVVFNAAYVKNNLAVRFRPPVRFLSVSPLAGTVPAGSHMDLNVLFNAAGLFGGQYDGYLRINGNDPVLPQMDIPAQLTVTGVPDISASPSPLNFGPVYIGYPKLLQLTVTNAGTDILHVTDVTTTDPVFGVDLTSFNVPPLGNAVLFVSFNPTGTGAYNGSLTLVSDDPDAPNYVVGLSGSGLVAPDIDPDPTSLTSTLTIPDSETQTVTLHNTGGSDLNFVVGAQVTASSVPVYEEVDTGKDGVDPRPGILGSGGPDMFGYTWRDSDEPGGPVFDWVDISTIGFVIPITGDDQNVQGTPIGFDFPFYGNTFSTVNVCSNGWISFTSTSTSLSNQPLPNSSTSVPNNLLAAFWDDLDPRPGNKIYGYRDGTRLIISYINVPRLSSGGPYTFQIILYPSGRIVYQYLTMSGTRLNEATIGMQNGDRTDGLTVVHNASYVHNSLAVEFRTVPDWLTVSPTSGTVPAGSSAILNVLFDSEGLYGRTYNGALRITSNDPDEGLKVIPATLTAIGVPNLATAPAALDFGTIYIGQTADRVVTVQNAGSGDLTVNSFALTGFSAGSFSVVSPSFPFTLGERGQQPVTVRFAPGAECIPCTADLVFNSDDPDDPAHAVPLTGNALIPPEIGVSPDSLRAALATTLGPTAITRTKQLLIENTGGSDLTWNAAARDVGTAASQVYDELLLAKGDDATGTDEATDPRPGILGSGGPDAFGYKWSDSDEPGGPTYNWIDISGVGTPVGFPAYEDDDNVGPVPIGFNFPFYGNTFSQLYVCTNGWVSFTDGTHETFTNQPLPNSGSTVPENLLAAWWDDNVYDESDGNYAVYHNDGSKLIIEFFIRRIGQTAPPYYNFEIILYPSGKIVYQYRTLGPTVNSATIGIQNATKNVGLTVAYNTAYVHTGLAIQFTAAPEWLSVSPESGVIPAGGSQALDVTFDATGLADGDYAGEIEITSNDLDEPVTTVPCFLHVGVLPAVFEMDPNTLNRNSGGLWTGGLVDPPSPALPNDIRTSSVLVERTVPVAEGAPLSYDATWAYYKFDRASLLAILPLGNSVPVEVIGEVEDVTWFQGTDYIRVLKPKMTTQQIQSTGPIVYTAGSTEILTWEDPEGYVADYFDLWYSANGGDSWTLVQGGITTRSYTWQIPADVTEHGMIELVAVDAQGVMGSWLSPEFSIVGATSGVDDHLPAQFAVRIAGSNPVRGATRLELALPESRHVDIQIFDIRGSVVRQWPGQELDAGLHSVSWDGSNSGGRKVSAGVYLVRVIAGEDTKVIRLHVLP